MKSSTRFMLHIPHKKQTAGENAFGFRWQQDENRLLNSSETEKCHRSKSRRSMNQREFLNVLEESKLLPSTLDKRIAIRVFKYVNTDSAVSDSDSKVSRLLSSFHSVMLSCECAGTFTI